MNQIREHAEVCRSLELSVVIPALNEGLNLEVMLPELRIALSALGIGTEILIVTDEKDFATRQAAERAGATVLIQEQSGYGPALITGFRAAVGNHVITMDADLSHPPDVLESLWNARSRADIVIASRYVEGGKADMPVSRSVLSRVLNQVFSRGLSLGVRDMSSGFRLYHRHVIDGLEPSAVDFDILQKILVSAYAAGWSVCEVPFVYAPRRYGRSHARVLKFGAAYARTFWSLWKLRNSILCADYDARAYNSPIFLQRYWQRSRYRHVTDLMKEQGRVLDVGCGSSLIIGALPPGSVAMDILARKLRYDRRYGRWLVRASGFQIPFADASFPCVVCSQVIEHVPKDSRILEELHRVLRPGGRLILGTPDYNRWEWVVTEKLYGWAAPGAYADEHISHYTRDELITMFISKGYIVEDVRYILRGELILAFRRMATTDTDAGEPAATSDMAS